MRGILKKADDMSAAEDEAARKQQAQEMGRLQAIGGARRGATSGAVGGGLAGGVWGGLRDGSLKGALTSGAKGTALGTAAGAVGGGLIGRGKGRVAGYGVNPREHDDQSLSERAQTGAMGVTNPHASVANALQGQKTVDQASSLKEKLLG